MGRCLQAEPTKTAIMIRITPLDHWQAQGKGMGITEGGRSEKITKRPIINVNKVLALEEGGRTCGGSGMEVFYHLDFRKKSCTPW